MFAKQPIFITGIGTGVGKTYRVGNCYRKIKSRLLETSTIGRPG
jgi:dethiobiotin synthetase